VRRGRTVTLALAVLLVTTLVGAGILLVRLGQRSDHVEVVAFFDNSNGVFPGDDVRIRGVNVGTIEKIEPEPTRVKISFWFDGKYPVPADAKAVILSPTLVTARAIQLSPPYRGGPTLQSGALIPQQRTAVPVEWDDVRTQLQRLADSLQPTQPGGMSTLGSLIHTTAENLRGQGGAIRDAIIKLSQAVSILNDHSDDTYSAVKNLSVLVSALQDSTGLLRALNDNLASVTGLLADHPGEIANAVKDLNDVVGEVKDFVGVNDADPEPRRHQTNAACPAECRSQRREPLPTRPRDPERHCVGEQLRRSHHFFVRGNTGRFAAGRRAVGETMRAVPGADRQESGVQLPPAGIQPPCRGHRATQ
jgi:phospholipid/cholesterol/gamma-HCH transport system substrate-binding protein